MKTNPIAILTLGLLGSFAICQANASSLGVAGDYNLIALTGDINYSGPDIEGRVAAAEDIAIVSTYSWKTVSVGTQLGKTGTADDPYAMVAGGSIITPNNSHFAVNGGGDVISGIASSSDQFYFNDGGKNVTGSSSIDFKSLATYLDALSAQYGKLATTGTIDTTSSVSKITLTGTSKTLNVFNITAAEFSSTTQALNIEVPEGSTVIINVTDCTTATACTMNLTPFINGTQENKTNSSTILFNFPDATTLTANQAIYGAILAPYADLEGGGVVCGTIMVASDSSSGEIEWESFTGDLPPVKTPEPGTMALMGTGILSLAGLIRRRMRRGVTAAE